MSPAYTRHREENLLAELRRARRVIREQRAELDRVKREAAAAVDMCREPESAHWRWWLNQAAMASADGWWDAKWDGEKLRIQHAYGGGQFEPCVKGDWYGQE